MFVFLIFFLEDSRFMIDDDSVDTRYNLLFVESIEYTNQSSSSLNMSGKAKESKTLPASVPLSEMLKLDKLIKAKKELLEVKVQQFFNQYKRMGYATKYKISRE